MRSAALAGVSQILTPKISESRCEHYGVQLSGISQISTQNIESRFEHYGVRLACISQILSQNVESRCQHYDVWLAGSSFTRCSLHPEMHSLVAI